MSADIHILAVTGIAAQLQEVVSDSLHRSKTIGPRGGVVSG